MSERRDAIIRVASEIFASRGFQATTVREIADECGILSGSLYHHFTSKEDLALEALRGYYEDLLAKFRDISARERDPKALFAQLVAASCRGIAEYPTAVALIQRSGDYLLQLDTFVDLAKANDEMRNTWLRTVRAGIKDGVWSADVDPQLVYRSVRDVLSGAAHWWKPGGRDSIEQLAEKYTNLFLYGMVGGPRSRRKPRALQSATT